MIFKIFPPKYFCIWRPSCLGRKSSIQLVNRFLNLMWFCNFSRKDIFSVAWHFFGGFENLWSIANRKKNSISVLRAAFISECPETQKKFSKNQTKKQKKFLKPVYKLANIFSIIFQKFQPDSLRETPRYIRHRRPGKLV